MKNKLLIILMAIALFIPTVIAVVYYSYMTSTPVEQREFSKVEITGSDEKTFVLERGNDKDVNATLDFLVNMNKNAKELDYTPELDEKYHLKFKYYHYSEGFSFDYYFPMTDTGDGIATGGGYYKNEEGDTYKLEDGDVKRFVATTYARSLYDNIGLPELKLSGAEGAVIPQDVVWTFREVGGEYVNYDTTYDVTKDIKTYEIADNFGMRFSVEPTVFTIKVTQGGANIYDGNYAEFSPSIELDTGKPVSIEVKAQWAEALSAGYAGELSYRFDANLIPPPTFTMTTSEYEEGKFSLEPGSVIVVSGKDIKDTSDLSFTSSVDLGYEPKWYTNPETGKVYTIVPIPVSLDKQGITEITVTVASGGTVKEETFSFADANFTTLDNVNEPHFESEMKEIIAELGEPADGTYYFGGAFADPVSDARYKGLRGFGRKADGKYTHVGVDFKDVTSGDLVYAGAAGEIVYSGTLSAGENVVVIHHGLGLYSWYMNLNIDGAVIIGEKVEAGALLGKCIDGKNFHASITIGDVAVSPYKFWAFTTSYSDFLLLK